MTSFIPVNYRNKPYPSDIHCCIKEVAAHFDKNSIEKCERYSLHTEYSFARRNFNSKLISKYPALRESYRGIPKLWFDDEWSREFANFIIDIVRDNSNPEVIEVHPPFKDYCGTFDEFIDRYLIFEEIIKGRFPSTIITVENRCGTQCSHRFLLSTLDDVILFTDTLKVKGCDLMVAMDYPQLFTAELYDFSNIPINDFIDKHKELKRNRDKISSIHLWGKKQNAKGRWVAHVGSLDDILGENKHVFLRMLNDFYDDGKKRYFVPEINAGNDVLSSIVEDCVDSGIVFTD